MGGAGVFGYGSFVAAEGLGTGFPCPFWVGGLFGNEALGEEAVVLVVTEDEVIEEVDVEDVTSFDEFGGYFFVGSAGFGVAGWMVVDDHDGIYVGE
jgi:proteasome assembly chaperone (PAC2) family protein